MIVSRPEFLNRQGKFLRSIKDGAVFIYPTDTVYGIGCDATNEKAVQKLRELKHRNVRPLSVIAPSKEWILEHCEVDPKELERLPGPYTLIMKTKNQPVAPSVPMGKDTLGVRIPAHWISDIVEAYGKPIVTTSANLTGQDVMQRLDDLPTSLQHVDFIIYEGEKRGVASELVDLTGPVSGLIASLRQKIFNQR